MYINNNNNNYNCLFANLIKKLKNMKIISLHFNLYLLNTFFISEVVSYQATDLFNRLPEHFLSLHTNNTKTFYFTSNVFSYVPAYLHLVSNYSSMHNAPNNIQFT